MDLLAFYTKLYGHLYCSNLPPWLFTPLRRLVRISANKRLPIWFKQHTVNPLDYHKGLIVSFTSFPARIDNVWKVVESLKRQTILPEKIILWLSKEQFPSKETIPNNLKSREDSLFEIRIVDGDIRSHKKYYYALKEFPDKTFITCDDDVFYDANMIKRLIDASHTYRGCIIANHTTRITYKDNGDVMSYSGFEGGVKPFSYDNLIQIGIGGVLYPPDSLHELCTNMDLFMELTPLADDIWLNAMARLKKTPVVQSSRDYLSLPIIDSSPSLSEVNNGENKNDAQIKNLRAFLNNNGYEDVYKSSYKITLPSIDGSH